MDLKIEGQVIDVLDEVSGESRNGPWRKQDFILETAGEYPRKVCVTQWGDDIEAFGVGVGDRLTAHINLQSREYNGRWYTDVKAWKVEKDGGAEGPTPGAATASGPGRPAAASDDGLDDDLPF